MDGSCQCWGRVDSTQLKIGREFYLDPMAYLELPRHSRLHVSFLLAKENSLVSLAGAWGLGEIDLHTTNFAMAHQLLMNAPIPAFWLVGAIAFVEIGNVDQQTFKVFGCARQTISGDHPSDDHGCFGSSPCHSTKDVVLSIIKFKQVCLSIRILGPVGVGSRYTCSRRSF